MDLGSGEIAGCLVDHGVLLCLLEMEYDLYSDMLFDCHLFPFKILLNALIYKNNCLTELVGA